MKKAVYPGSFDPVTNGHIDIITRAGKVFEQLVVAVANNPTKKSVFTIEERMEFLREVTKNMPNVEIGTFDHLLVDFLRATGINVVVRGLRAVTDFEMEFQMALVNKDMMPEMETVFLVTNTDFSFLSSTIIKEVASFKGSVSGFVPPIVEKGLKKRFNNC